MTTQRDTAKQPGDPAQESLQEFERLAETWKRDTAAVSSVSEVARHPAYQEIIAMGKMAIPLILRHLQAEPNHWFSALVTLSGEDPISPDARGNVRRMREAWLTWGRSKGNLKQGAGTSLPSSRD